MGLPAPKLSLILVACVFALSCFGFTLYVWKSFGGSTPLEAHGYRFHVLFGSEASQLTPNADVRISGVNVGKVISVTRRGLNADALIEMQDQFAPVPRDTRAIIRFKTLLGETFVELTPGTRRAPKLAEGATLPRANVAAVQQVDRVLGSFDQPTRAAFKLFLQRTAKALAGRGPDLNSALGHLAPATESVDDLVRILDRQRGALSTLVRNSGVALHAVSARQADLRSLITASNAVFATTARRDQDLRRLVRALPGFLSQTRGALDDIDGALKVARPTLAALRPVIPLIRPALLETRRLAPTVQTLFTDLGPVVSSARTGLPALTRILTAAKPTIDVLDIAGQYLIPLADYLRLYRGDVIDDLAKLGAAVNFVVPAGSPDSGGQRIARLINPITEETLVGYSRRLPSNRHNAYTLPGEVARLASNRLRSFDCRNLHNPQTVPVLGSGAPPCIVAPPLRFRGLTAQFPHLVPATGG